jgi:hypothetical protein
MLGPWSAALAAPSSSRILRAYGPQCNLDME